MLLNRAHEGLEIKEVKRCKPMKLINTEFHPYRSEKDKNIKFSFMYVRFDGAKPKRVNINDKKVVVFAFDTKKERDKAVYLLNTLSKQVI